MQIRTQDDIKQKVNLRGLAILVPEIVLITVSPVDQADVILDPGAQTSTHDP